MGIDRDDPDRFRRGSSVLGGDIQSKQMPKAKPLPKGVTDSMHNAMLWFKSQGGEGAWTKPKGERYHILLARGESGKFQETTWNALGTLGYVEIGQPGRLRITKTGEQFLREHPKKVITLVPRQGRVDPYPGAE